MTTILEQQVTNLLTAELGRAPTAEELADGLIAPRTLAQLHNSLNVTQSVFTVSPGDDLQVAIDKLVLNGGGTLYLNPGTFTLTDDLILYTGIHIEGSGSDNSIIDFGNLAKQIQVIGTLGNEVVSVALNGFTVQNSTTHLVRVDYAINFNTNDLTSRNGLSGIYISNTDTYNIYSSLQDSCGTGLIATNCTFATLFSSNATGSTTGGGVVMTNVTNSTSIACSVDSCVGVGYLFDGCSDFGFEDFAITNITGVGLDFTGGSFAIGVLDGFIDTCSSDGIRIEGAAGNLQITGANTMSNNGGYGINVTVGSDNVLIVANSFSGNSSGAVNDAGTATLIRSNQGVADN